MDKATVETFVKRMDSAGKDYDASIRLVEADEKGFVIEITDSGGDSESTGECRFAFVHSQEHGELLRVTELFGDDEFNLGKGWLIEAVPALAFAICYAGS